MVWTSVAKPSSSNYTNVNALGKEQYDQSDLTYDSATTYYDGINPDQWTEVAKPTGEGWGPDLVTNGGFDGNADGWYIGDAGAYNFDNMVIFDSGGGSGTLAFGQNLPTIENGVTYRVEFDVVPPQTSSPDENTGRVQLGDNSSVNFPGFVGHVSLDIVAEVLTPGNGAISFSRGFFLDAGYIDNVSVKEFVDGPAWTKVAKPS